MRRIFETRENVAFSHPVSFGEFLTFLLVLVFITAVCIGAIFYLPEKLSPLFEGIALVFLLGVYVFPSILAWDLYNRFSSEGIDHAPHPSRIAILLTNIILGWTLFIWIGTLWWALDLVNLKVTKITNHEIEI